VTTGVLWSTAGVLIHSVAWSSGAIWCVRSAVAAASLWGVRRVSLRGLSRLEWLSAAALAATTGLFVLANRLTTPANAILIQYSAPAWVALLGGRFLGEPATRRDWIAIAVVWAGIALFFFDHLSADGVAGNVAAAGAGVTFAVNVMCLRKLAAPRGPAVHGGAEVQPRDPVRPLVLGNLVGAVLGAPFLVTSGPVPDARGWLALVALGVVQQTAANLCYATAIRHATALEAMLMPVIEPILSPLWVAVAFGDWPSPWAIAGGALVLGAIVGRAVTAGVGGRPAPAADPPAPSPPCDR
jgi:drug/metabolite transporter (DMT)-like permease